MTVARGQPKAVSGSGPLPWVLFAGAAVVLLAFAAWIALSIGGATVTKAVDDLVTLAAAAFAAIACLRATRRVDPRLRRFWLLLAAASLAWTFGEGAWAVYDLFLDGAVPTPSYADLGYLAAVPFAVAALLSHPGDRRANRTRAFLDGSILATALLFLSWTYALGPVWQQNDVTTTAGLVSVAYPFGDVVLLFLVVRVLLVLDPAHRRAIGFVLAGLLAMSLSDSAYTYLTAVRAYSTGNVIDIGWVAAYLALVAGAMSAAGAVSGAGPVSTEGAPARRAACVPTRNVSAVAVLAPYFPVLVALLAITVRIHTGAARDLASLLLAFALTSLVLVRQGLAALDRPESP
jgi:hypothetical protein